MINKILYEALCLFDKNGYLLAKNVPSNYKSAIQFLFDYKYISVAEYTPSFKYYIITKYRIEVLGITAKEEYEREIEHHNIEKSTLLIADKSNRKATISNWIALLSALISFGAMLISLLK